MIENIRKYTGLMTVVFVLLFIGLLYMGNGNNKGYGSGEVVVTAHGTAYPEQAYRRLAENPVRLLQELSGASFQAQIAILGFLYEMATSDDALPTQNGLDARRYLVNRLSLQQGAREFGIHASDTEIDEFMRESIFVSQSGDFDELAYEEFVEKSLPRLGMGKKDLYVTLGEVLIYQKLGELLGSGLLPSRDALLESIETNLQQVDYQLVEFKSATYEAKEDPSEEQVREFWENNKGRYLAEPRRKITYIVAKPDFTAATEEKAKDVEPEEEEESEPEATADSDTPTTPKPPVVLSREEKEDVIADLGSKVDDLWVSIQDAEGGKFEELATAAGYTPVTSELITKADVPGVLRGTIRDHSINGVQSIFDHHYPGANAMDRLSDVLRINNNWIIYRIDDAEDSKELTYDEAKADARLDWIKEKAHEAMAKAAEEAREKLLASLEAGKSFPDAAKELELTPVAQKEVSGRKPAAGEPTPREIFNLVSRVNPGELSDVLTQTDEGRSVFRSVIAFVDKRELVDDDQLKNTIEQGYRNQESSLKRLAFSNWLSQKYAAAGVSYP